MKRERGLLLVNAVLPGGGLVVAGHLGLGLALLLAAIPLIAVFLAASLLLVGPFAGRVQGGAAMLYGVLAAVAVAADRWYAWRRRIDPQRVRAVHQQACAAWLTARTPAALAQAVVLARRLVDAAPEEAGAWRFLARVAQDAGDTGLAKRADARADAIELR